MYEDESTNEDCAGRPKDLGGGIVKQQGTPARVSRFHRKHTVTRSLLLHESSGLAASTPDRDLLSLEFCGAWTGEPVVLDEHEMIVLGDEYSELERKSDSVRLTLVTGMQRFTAPGLLAFWQTSIGENECGLCGSLS